MSVAMGVGVGARAGLGYVGSMGFNRVFLAVTRVFFKII